MKASELLKAPMRFARRNLALKLLALGLAVVTWWFVTGESKVLVSFNVPLEIRNVPPGMTLTNKVETHVEVRLQGPSSILAGFKSSEISMALDLSAGKPGRQIVKFDPAAVRVPPGVAVQRIFPQAVEVVLARTERRRIPVSVRMKGGSALRSRIASIEYEPKEIEVEALPEEFTRMPFAYTEEIAPDPGTDTYEAEARVDLREPHAKISGDRYIRVKIRFRR